MLFSGIQKSDRYSFFHTVFHYRLECNSPCYTVSILIDPCEDPFCLLRNQLKPVCLNRVLNRPIRLPQLESFNFVSKEKNRLSHHQTQVKHLQQEFFIVIWVLNITSSTYYSQSKCLTFRNVYFKHLVKVMTARFLPEKHLSFLIRKQCME